MHQPHMMEFFHKTTSHFTNTLPERVECALKRSPQLCGYDVACEECGDAVVLSGNVPSYYLKQVAQTVAGSVEGVHRVVNQVHVG